MLNDRGYSFIDGEFEIIFEKFLEKFSGELHKDELTIIASNPENPQDLLIVFFVETDGKNKISKKMISSYYERMKGQEISRSILVLPVKLTTPAETSLQSFQEG